MNGMPNRSGLCETEPIPRRTAVGEILRNKAKLVRARAEAVFWRSVARDLMGAMLTGGLVRVGMEHGNMPFREDPTSPRLRRARA